MLELRSIKELDDNEAAAGRYRLPSDLQHTVPSHLLTRLRLAATTQACPLCGSTRGRFFIYRARGYDDDVHYIRCQNCDSFRRT